MVHFPHRSVRCGGLCLALFGCSANDGEESPAPGRPLPPLAWAGEVVSIYHEPDRLICEGTYEYADDFARNLQRMYSTEGTIDFYLLDFLPTEYADASCTSPDALACATADGIYSTLLPLGHELVHAVMWPPTTSFLEEGYAGYFARPPSGGAPDLDVDILQEIDAFPRTIPGDLYPVAAHFVAYLDERFGTELLIELRQAIGDVFDRQALNEEFTQVLGVSLTDLVAMYEAEATSCRQDVFWNPIVVCSSDAMNICDASQDSFRLEVEVDCASGAAGPVDGVIWKEAVIAVPAAGRYGIVVEGEGATVTMSSCAGGCSAFRESFLGGPSSTLPPPSLPIDLPEGNILLRIEGPTEMPGTVVVTIDHPCEPR